jgi:hypothetical protein
VAKRRGRPPAAPFSFEKHASSLKYFPIFSISPSRRLKELQAKPASLTPPERQKEIS